jgi:hypothetical protein
MWPIMTMTGAASHPTMMSTGASGSLEDHCTSMDSLEILLQGACQISHNRETIFEDATLEDVNAKTQPTRIRRNAFSIDRKAIVALSS